MPDNRVIFFLSYASANRDPYLQIFFDDLSAEVRHCLGAKQTENVGFMDVKGIEVGADWNDELARALQECCVFVSLYTPAYFKSAYCGKEWAVFRARQEARAGGPGAIIPLLWGSADLLPEPLPPAAAGIQYSEGDFGEEYKRQGLRQLLRLEKRYRDEYLSLVSMLAARICAEAKEAAANPLPPLPSLGRLEDIPNAFGEPNQPPPAPLAATLGPRFVKFVLVAASRDEIAQVRGGLDFYGEGGGFDWKPYWDEVKETLGMRAQGIATERQLYSEVTPPGGNLVGLIEDAQEKNHIVVIVVDTWTLQLESYRSQMQSWGRKSFYNCVLLVPWGKDPETVAARQSLVDRLAATLPSRILVSGNDESRRLTALDEYCVVDRINTWEELVKELGESLNQARMRISMISKYVNAAGPGQAPPRF